MGSKSVYFRKWQTPPWKIHGLRAEGHSFVAESYKQCDNFGWDNDYSMHKDIEKTRSRKRNWSSSVCRERICNLIIILALSVQENESISRNRFCKGVKSYFI